MRSVHKYDLSVDRSRGERIRDLALGSFVQVIRCDTDAVLREGPSGFAIPAAPGIVLRNQDGLYLQNDPTITGASPSVSQAGILLLISYESPDEILDVASYVRTWGTRLLDFELGIGGASANITLQPATADAMFIITGILAEYDSAPTTLGNASVTIGTGLPNITATRIVYFRFTPRGADGPWKIESWFPAPLIAPPGHQVVAEIAAGGAGVVPALSLYGGVLYM